MFLSVNDYDDPEQLEINNFEHQENLENGKKARREKKKNVNSFKKIYKASLLFDYFGHESISSLLNEGPVSIHNVDLKNLNQLFLNLFREIKHRGNLLCFSTNCNSNSEQILICEIMLPFYMEAINQRAYIKTIFMTNKNLAPNVEQYLVTTRRKLKKQIVYFHREVIKYFIENFRNVDCTKAIFPNNNDFKTEFKAFFVFEGENSLEEKVRRLKEGIDSLPALIERYYKTDEIDQRAIPIWLEIGRVIAPLLKANPKNEVLCNMRLYCLNKILESRKKNYSKNSIKEADALKNLTLVWDAIGDKEKKMEVYKKTLEYYIGKNFKNYPEVYFIINKIKRSPISKEKEIQYGGIQATILSEVKTQPYFEKIRGVFSHLSLEDALLEREFGPLNRLVNFELCFDELDGFFNGKYLKTAL